MEKMPQGQMNGKYKALHLLQLLGEVPLVTEIKNQILGTSKMVKTNSAREGDDTVVESAGSEATAIDEIENEFGMPSQP